MALPLLWCGVWPPPPSHSKPCPSLVLFHLRYAWERGWGSNYRDLFFTLLSATAIKRFFSLTAQLHLPCSGLVQLIFPLKGRVSLYFCLPGCFWCLLLASHECDCLSLLSNQQTWESVTFLTLCWGHMIKVLDKTEPGSPTPLSGSNFPQAASTHCPLTPKSLWPHLGLSKECLGRWGSPHTKGDRDVRTGWG